jgi:2-(1,2-epoxy-1,2-dihydrophenyl)acetyl-CoA isomerase
VTSTYQPSAAAAEPPVLTADSDGVRMLTLNRPRAFNSFNLELKSALLAALAAAAADSSVRAVVITGAGRAFCAGQDLKEHLALVAADDPRVAATVSEFYNPLIIAITGMAKPVIAAVNGVAAGAGAGLAFACDLRIVGRAATFSMAFAGVGLSADSGSSFLLPRLIGQGRASKMMLLGEQVDAEEALRIGMADMVVADDELAGTVRETAARLAAGPTKAFGCLGGPRVNARVRGPGTEGLLRLCRPRRSRPRVRGETARAVHRELKEPGVSG